MRFGYSYSTEQCDIEDKTKAELFRRRREEWDKWLIGPDPHAISRQISSMLWSHALFCIVNDLRNTAKAQPQSGVGFNDPVLRLFDAGFVSTQATAIRRLIEKPDPNPKKAVISLRSILAEMKKHIDLFTRENYVCYDGLPYDHETVHQQWLSELPIGNTVQSDLLPTTGPKAWYMSERMHHSFDEIAGVSAENRQRTDTVQLRIFDDLECLIHNCEDIKKYVDKFIAHAAAPESREELTDTQRGVTLDRLKTHHKIIFQVAEFISTRLLYGTSLGGMPVPQYDHLKNLDKSWTTTGDLKQLREKWLEYDQEVSAWRSSSVWPLVMER